MADQLVIGQRVIVRSGPPDHGEFTGHVTRFERDGNVAIITPDDPALRLWFTTGYDIGKAHWGQAVIPYQEATDAGTA
jgi:hypothetical protein